MTDGKEKAAVLVEAMVHVAIKAGIDETDIAGALLVAAHSLCMTNMGPEAWAVAMERAAAVTRANIIAAASEGVH